MPQAEIPRSGLVLFNAPASTCSQKVRLVLAEKSLAREDRRVDLRSNEHLEDWYLALNPNAVVPTLLHDGRVIVDSSVINEYLEDSLVPTVVRLEDLQLARLWSDLPRVADWYGRVRERPSFAKTYYQGSRPAIAEAIC